MNGKFGPYALLGLLAILAAACVPLAAGAAPEAGPSPVEDRAALISALQEAGAQVEEGEPVEQVFFSVPGQTLKVNGADVQVFAYDTPEAMASEAEQVAADGGSIGTNMVAWIEAPHFYKSGRLIVLYVGEDSPTLDLLQGVLGEQFAGR